MAKEKPEDFVVDVVHRFSDLITDIDHYGDCPHLPFDHNEYIALNCNLKPIDNIYENNENNTLQEEWHCNQIDDKNQIELQCVQTQHKHNKQHSNANKGTKRSKVGRKSLKTLGFSDEEIKLRIQEQNKCAQQRKRDRMRDMKMRLISETNNNHNSSLSLSSHNGMPTSISTSQPQSPSQSTSHSHHNSRSYYVSGEQLHIYSDALSMAINTTGDMNTKNKYISFVLNNFQQLLSTNN